MTMARTFLTQVGLALEVGANLVTDGDMELVGVANWTADGAGTTVAKNTTTPHGGTRDLQVQRVSGTTGYAYQTISVTAGRRYRVHGWFETEANMTAWVSIYNVDGAALIITKPVSISPSVSYSQFTFEFTAPTGCTQIQLRLGWDASAGTNSAYFDDVSIRFMDYGTAVNPSIGIPINEISESPTYEVILDNALRGIAAVDFKSIQGVGHTEISIEGLAYPEEFGYWLKMILGAVGTTYNGTIYTHAFQLNGFPQSATLEADIISGTNGGARMSGVRLTQLQLSFDAGERALAYSLSAIGKISTKVTSQNPARVDNTPWAGWRGVVTSTGYAARIVSMELTLAREGTRQYVAQASQDLKHLNVGPLVVSGRIVAVAETFADYDNFKSHLTQSFQLDFDQGSGATQKKLTLLATNLNFADGPVELDRSAEGVLFAVPIRGIYNATDVGPIQATLINARTSYES